MQTKSKTFASHVRQRHFPWGGQVLVSRYPAHNSVSIVGSISGGTRLMGEELARVHAAMLLEGTRSHTKEELQRTLDEIGATLSFYPTRDRLCFFARVLSKHAEKMLTIVAEVLQESTFPIPELAILKKREEATLSYEAQDTQKQAAILLLQKLFPQSHPNYQESTEASRSTLASITNPNLVRLHARMLSRQSLIVSIAGDIEYTPAVSLVDKHFKTLPNCTVRFPKFPKAPSTHQAYVSIVIPEKTSIDYLIGQTTGITKTHTAYVPLQLGVQILGNPGFSGRLFKKVREEKGLTYGVSAYTSGFSPSVDGYINVWGTFAPQLFAQGRKAIKDEIEDLIQKGATDQEVQLHKDLFISRSEVALSNSEAFARTAHDLAADDRPMAYLDSLRLQVSKLTTAQINKALGKYLIPERMVESAAGPVEKNMLGA